MKIGVLDTGKDYVGAFWDFSISIFPGLLFLGILTCIYNDILWPHIKEINSTSNIMFISGVLVAAHFLGQVFYGITNLIFNHLPPWSRSKLLLSAFSTNGGNNLTGFSKLYKISVVDHVLCGDGD